MMLCHPYQSSLPVFPGTRILQADFGLVGYQFQDPHKLERFWRVTRFYAPARRKLGGVRVRLEDQKGFVTFCNQRDFELLLGIGQPGKPCMWLGEEYPSIHDEEFFGLCADEDDLKDDLYERELLLREQNPGVLPYGTEVKRRVHTDRGLDFEELWTLFWDCDPDTGYGPDPRFETLERRWSRIERNRVRWLYL